MLRMYFDSELVVGNTLQNRNHIVKSSIPSMKHSQSCKMSIRFLWDLSSSQKDMYSNSSLKVMAVRNSQHYSLYMSYFQDHHKKNMQYYMLYRPELVYSCNTQLDNLYHMYSSLVQAVRNIPQNMKYTR